MKRLDVILMMSCLALAGTACNESKIFEDIGAKECVVGTDWKSCTSDTAYLQCVGGTMSSGTCLADEKCQNDVCVKAGPTPKCTPDGDRCDGRDLVTCAGGVESRRTCENGCSNDACVPAPSCSPDGDRCDGRDLVTCAGGVESRRTCENGCSNDACVAKCGDGVREGSEICDGKDIGGLTCHDVPHSIQSAAYKGKPVCNGTCDGLEMGTCEQTLCGNNRLDAREREFCDVVDGVSKFLISVTCSDIKGYPEGTRWQEGGTPGCPADCGTNLKLGTCKLEPQPLGGIQMCEFTDLAMNEARSEVSGRAVVHTIDGIDTSKVFGILACGNLSAPTYAWNKSSARFMQCEDCEAQEFRMVSEADISSYHAGTYGCAFQVRVDTKDIDGSNSTTYYNCPVRMGYPHAQGMPDESVMRTFSVEGEPVEGAVLAHWDFSGFSKNETVKSAGATDGVMSSRSTVSLSDGSMMTMVSGTMGFPDMAVSGDRWSSAESLDLNAKHFVIRSSSAGYKNVRVRFMVASSGDYAMPIEVAYRSGSSAKVIGSAFSTRGGREFVKYEAAVRDDSSADIAANQNSIELDIYTYGSGDVNLKVRLDDIYILADPL